METEETYENIEVFKPVASRPLADQTAPHCSTRPWRGVVVFLGLLCGVFLASLVGLGVHFAELSSVKADLAERLQTSKNQISDLTEDRDRLNVSLFRMITTMKTCPAGWRKSGCSCYFLSRGTGPWETGRDDCRDRGADLIVIDNAEEQGFISGFRQNAWIGLTDVDEEGTWTWVDGSAITLSSWDRGQPDNGGDDPQYSEENCAYIRSTGKWNDLSCTDAHRWICEKMA